MCSIFFAINSHPEFSFVLAANRDEFISRAASPMEWWDSSQGEILSGRDLVAGGTWFCINRNGKWAAVTNIRNFYHPIVGEKSRGELPIGFMDDAKDVHQYIEEVEVRMKDYSGFNLLLGNNERVSWMNNETETSEVIPTGIHGLSNAFLNSDWPKVLWGKHQLNQILEKETEEASIVEALFSMLSSENKAKDGALPDTGIGIEKERLLSSVCIRSKDYGTRVSTVMLQSKKGEILVIEKNALTGEQRSFRWS